MAAIAAMVSGAGRSAAAGPVEHAVTITGFKFEPETVIAAPGDTVTWTNTDIVPHTATARDKSWDTGTIGRGKSKSLVIGDDHRTDYFCRFHPMMTARVESASQ